MASENQALSGHASLLILTLLAEQDRYGYQMMEELARRSDQTFQLKAGTLYPLLHGLEQKGFLTAYDQSADGRMRKFYHLTKSGKKRLAEQETAWEAYVKAVEQVRKRGEPHAEYS